MATFVAYLPAVHGGFIWDDDGHVSNNNTLRTLHGLWQIWFEPSANCQYYPLTFTAFWAEYQLWNLGTFGYHVVNVLMHATVAVLLWQVLKRLQVRGARLAAAIFALHPVCVMSVAWMTELKNTLSATLALCAALAYLRATGLGEGDVTSKPRPLNGWYYAASLALFQLALFAKTAVSFLPVTLLLVTWWRERRLNWRTVWPLAPLFGISLAMGRMTIFIEQHAAGASGARFDLSFLERLLISGRSFWFYLGNLLLPHLSPFVHERWKVDPAQWPQYVYPAATVALLGGLWCRRRRLGKGLLVALLHFYVSTSLLIFMVVLYMMRYTFVSDHWQYFGSMGVVAAAAAGIMGGLELVGKGRPLLKPVVCGLLLMALGTLTWRQCGMYRDMETLWRVSLEREPDNHLAHANLGQVLIRRGEMDEAIYHMQKALELEPDNSDDHSGLANAYYQRGRVEDAIQEYELAVKYEKKNFMAHINLANILAGKGRMTEAISHYRSALAVFPEDGLAWNDLGAAQLQTGRQDDAISSFQKAVQAKPDFVPAQENLDLVAWSLATSPDPSARNGARAVELSRPLVRLTGGSNALFLSTLSAAYAESGQFPEAVTNAQRALKVAENQNNAALVSDLKTELGLYQKDLPYRTTNTTANTTTPAIP